jgi:hypothetical protein
MDDIDSSQSSACSSRSSVRYNYNYKQHFVPERITHYSTSRIRSSSAGDNSQPKNPNTLALNKRHKFGRKSSLPGLNTTNATWDWDSIDSSESVVKTSPMIEQLRKKSHKKRSASAYAASRMIQELNESEGMAAAIAIATEKKVAHEDKTKKRQDERKTKEKSSRISRPVVIIDEPDDDGDLSMGSDDLSVSVHLGSLMSMNLDFSQSSIL